MAELPNRNEPLLKAEQFEHEELPRFKKRQELTEGEVESRDLLSDFILKLCRAVLQSSYYSPDHPQARKVADEPLTALHRLDKAYQEYNFVVASWLDGDVMALEGIFNEAIPIDQLVGGTAGEHFSKKLCDFCRRNRLVSFSIKDVIGDEEFHRFISVFVERHVDMEAQRLLDAGDDRRQRFTEQLLDKNIVNVGVVLEDDLVEERRRLPWRVKIALARLKKDLKALPLYSRATTSQLREAKLRILRDILRPMQKGQYLKQLFLNLDLISSEVEDLRGVDMETDLLAALSGPRIASLAEALHAEHIRVNKKALSDAGDERPDLADALKSLIPRVVRALTDYYGSAGVERVLRDLYDAGAVAESHLPPPMQEQIRIDRWCANYLAAPERVVTTLDRIDRADAYAAQLPTVVAAIPNLLRLKRYGAVDHLLSVIAKHRASEGAFPGRPALVQEAFDGLADGPLLATLVDAMMIETTEVRDAIRRTFSLFGRAATPSLLDVFLRAETSALRNEAGLALIGLGADAIPFLEHALVRRGQAPAVLVDLLKVLTQLSARDSTDLVVDLLRHASAEVREAALSTVVKLNGKASRGLLVRAMRDPEPRIAVSAMRALSRLDPKPLGYVLRLLETAGLAPREPGEPETDTLETQVTAVQLLAELGNVPLGQGGTLEARFLSRVELEGGRMKAILQRGKRHDDEPVRIAILDALVKIGGPESAERLRSASLEPSPVVRERMKLAAAQLAERLQMS